jgi:hypothetical protein
VVLPSTLNNTQVKTRVLAGRTDEETLYESVEVANGAKVLAPVSVGTPEPERELMTLYPQRRGRTPAVEYVPAEPAPATPLRREIPRMARR